MRVPQLSLYLALVAASSVLVACAGGSENKPTTGAAGSGQGTAGSGPGGSGGTTGGAARPREAAGTSGAKSGQRQRRGGQRGRVRGSFGDVRGGRRGGHDRHGGARGPTAARGASS